MDKTGFVAASMKSTVSLIHNNTESNNPESAFDSEKDSFKLTDDVVNSGMNLKLAKAQKKALALRNQRREIEEVSLLQSDPTLNAVKHDFDKLSNLNESKRLRHDKSYKSYRSVLRKVSDDIEVMYVTEASNINDLLNSIDNDIDVLFNELNQDDLLRQRDLTYVNDMWDKINNKLQSRTSSVASFEQNLSDFETKRSDTLATHLRTMVDSMVKISLKLPQEIERVAEIEAYELNCVIISNRLTHCELIARMEKEDIYHAVKCRELWEGRLSDWRDLRHARGIAEFHDDINDDSFKNPVSRILRFDAFKKEQTERHGRRKAILGQLGDMTNATLNSEEVNNVRASFKALHEEEVHGIKQLYDDIVSIRHIQHDLAEKRRENLRMELHNYGALKLEPDVIGYSNDIEQYVLDVNNEEYYRKSGGIKSELNKIVKHLRDENIIYDNVLKDTIVSLNLVQCGTNLENVLEKQGKSSLRKTLQDTLERLRKATKAECLPILPVLRTQCSNLAQVNDIDGLLKRELALCVDQLDDLIRFANIPKEGANPDEALLDATNNKAPSKAPSESNRSRSSSRRRSVSTAQPSKGWEEPELDMLVVRSVQKHVGMLLASCELTDEFKDILKECSYGCEVKKMCNDAIDNAVKDETTEPIKQRDYESDSLIDWVESSLSNQSIKLNSGSEKICGFYHEVAKILEIHRSKEIDIDDEASEELFNHKEDFRLANDVREADEEYALDRLRHAADENELETSFKKALLLLDTIESEYRVYHGVATRAANKHPVRVDDEHRHFCFMLCSRFGLVPPKDMLYPTESLDTDLSDKKIEKTVNLDDTGALGATAVTTVEGAAEEEKKEAGYTAAADPAADPAAAVEGGEENDAEGAESAAAAVPEPEPEPFSAPEVRTAELLWVEDITDTFNVSRYDYGVKIAPSAMVEEILAPPPADEEDDSLPQQIPTPAKTVKTPEQLAEEEEARVAAEEARLAEEAEKKKAAKGKKGKKAAEVVEEPEAEAEDLSEPVFFDTSTDFVLKDDKEVTDMSESDRNAYIENHDNSFIPLSQDEIDRLSDETFLVYEKVVSDVNVRRAIKARIMTEQKEKADSTPVDKDGTLCIVSTQLPPDSITDYISNLMSSLLMNMEDDSLTRKNKMDALCEERKEDLSEELDERLRLHWPRKGRTETKYRQPREGELVAHRQKSARFLRQFYKRLDEQESNFAALLSEVRSHADDFTGDVQALIDQLPAQGSLAALQGMEMKSKKFLSVFKVECEDFLEVMETFLGFEPQKLGNTITELIRLTKTFSNGGDYDQKEVDDLKQLLIEPKERLDAKVEQRIKNVEDITKYEVDATDISKAFKVEFERCLQELSLKEGLGKKYGAPRRNAQERLRTEVTRDEYSAANVDKLLSKLDKLCRIVKGGKGAGVKFTSAEGGDEDEDEEEAKLPLSIRIKHTVLNARAAIFQRVKYLEFNATPESDIGAENEIPQDKEEVTASVSWEGEDALIVGTFSQAIQKLQDQCKKETYDLYSAEGKTDLLGDAGVPESLQKWLENNWIKVLGSDKTIFNEAVVVCMDGKDTYTVKYTDGLEEKKVPAVLINEYKVAPSRAPDPPVHDEGRRVEVRFQCHREKARRRLRAQVERLENIIAKTPVPPNPTVLGAPSAIVVDVMRRCQNQSDDLRRKSEGGFKKLLDVWEAARVKHMNALRPQLGSPDAAGELAKLVAKEKKRGDEVISKVNKFKTKLLAMEADHAKETVLRLCSVTNVGLNMIDNMVLRDDLSGLPGDELILPKRKSLKRLRKAANGAAQEEEEGEDVAAAAAAAGGRKWSRRQWEALNLERMKAQMLESMVVPELTEEEQAEKERLRAEKEKEKAKGKKKGSVGGDDEVEDFGDENEVDKWAREAGAAGKFESYVTTAHRCLVKTAADNLENYSAFYIDNSLKINDRFTALEEKEKAWAVKWGGLVEDLVAMTANEGK
jgi:hypothetical protein